MGTGRCWEEAPTGRTGGRRRTTTLPWLPPASSAASAMDGSDARQDPTSPMCPGPCLLLRGQPPLLPAPHPNPPPSPTPSPAPNPSPIPAPSLLRSALPLHAAEQVPMNLPASADTTARAGCQPATTSGTAASLCHPEPGSCWDGPPGRARYGASGHRHMPMDHPVLMVGHPVPVVGHAAPVAPALSPWRAGRLSAIHPATTGVALATAPRRHQKWQRVLSTQRDGHSHEGCGDEDKDEDTPRALGAALQARGSTAPGAGAWCCLALPSMPPAPAPPQ